MTPAITLELLLSQRLRAPARSSLLAESRSGKERVGLA